MKPNQLQAEFEKLCRSYGGISSALGSQYNKGKKECSCDLLYRCVKLQLVYRAKSSFPAPPSTLYCRVYLQKNSLIYLHLPQLLPLMEKRDYRACYFPYIENTTRMKACFRALIHFLEELLPELEALSATGADVEILRRFIDEQGIRDVEPAVIMKTGSREQERFLRFLQLVENSYVVRYTVWKPWESYLFVDRPRALAQLQKQKQLYAYDRGLMEFLASPDSSGFLPMPYDCFALRDMRGVSRGMEDGGTIFLGMLVLYPLFAALGCLLMGALQLYYSHGTLCWFGAPWYMGFLVGAIPAMFGGIALRRQVIPILNRRTSKMQLDFDDIVNGTVINRIAIGAFWLMTAACLVLSLLMSGQCIRLYEDHGMADQESFAYEDVESVCYISARYNHYGDRIESPSYVIVLEDGTQIDFYGYADAEQTAEKALPIFLDLGIELIELDSDRDLPGGE